jgi:hypothetical protein
MFLTTRLTTVITTMTPVNATENPSSTLTPPMTEYLSSSRTLGKSCPARGAASNHHSPQTLLSFADPMR